MTFIRASAPAQPNLKWDFISIKWPSSASPPPHPSRPPTPRLIDRQLAEVDSIVELILTSDATEELFICVLSFTQRDGLFTLGNGLYFVSVWTMVLIAEPQPEQSFFG